VDRVLTIETAAALLHVTPRTLRTWAREGRVPARRPGRAWLFDREKLLELLDDYGDEAADAEPEPAAPSERWPSAAEWRTIGVETPERAHQFLRNVATHMERGVRG
jgi:excisionase family DNA binding protein